MLKKVSWLQQQRPSLGRKIKIAMLGGAFDPIQKGHIQVAKFVLDTSKVFDEVWLVPCYQHIYNKKMESPEHRLKMCELAAKQDERIKVFDYEIKNKLAGQTYHLVKRLLNEDFAKNQYDFSMIIGQDNANTFDKWVKHEDLERMIRFVVVLRNGIPMDPKVTWYFNKPHIFLSAENPLMKISSTEVRNWIKGTSTGHSAFELSKEALEDEVCEYIFEHKLYGVTE